MSASTEKPVAGRGRLEVAGQGDVEIARAVIDEIDPGDQAGDSLKPAAPPGTPPASAKNSRSSSGM